jgi:predicted XRE-type DNA-binding protein
MGGRFKPEFNARVREAAALQKEALKAALVRELGARVKGMGLTQEAAALRLGLYQPEVSLLLKGPSSEFSVWKLLRFLTLLGANVAIVVGRSAKGRNAGEVSVLSRGGRERKNVGE